MHLYIQQEGKWKHVRRISLNTTQHPEGKLPCNEDEKMGEKINGFENTEKKCLTEK